jgi:hypothetical protein
MKRSRIEQNLKTEPEIVKSFENWNWKHPEIEFSNIWMSGIEIPTVQY